MPNFCIKKYGFLLVFFYHFFAYSKGLNYTTLKQHRMNVGGQLAMPISYNRHDELNIGLKVTPFYGYFVLDNLEMRGSLMFSSKWAISSMKQEIPSPIIWSISATPIYYFNTEWKLKPYIGLGLGWQMTNFMIFSSRILIEAPVGLFMELDRNFALDIAFPIKWHISVRSAAEEIEFVIAHVGIRYVF